MEGQIELFFVYEDTNNVLLRFELDSDSRTGSAKVKLTDTKSVPGVRMLVDEFKVERVSQRTVFGRAIDTRHRISFDERGRPDFPFEVQFGGG